MRARTGSGEHHGIKTAGANLNKNRWCRGGTQLAFYTLTPQKSPQVLVQFARNHFLSCQFCQFKEADGRIKNYDCHSRFTSSCNFFQANGRKRLWKRLSTTWHVHRQSIIEWWERDVLESLADGFWNCLWRKVGDSMNEVFKDMKEQWSKFTRPSWFGGSSLREQKTWDRPNESGWFKMLIVPCVCAVTVVFTPCNLFFLMLLCMVNGDVCGFEVQPPQRRRTDRKELRQNLLDHRQVTVDVVTVVTGEDWKTFSDCNHNWKIWWYSVNVTTCHT